MVPLLYLVHGGLALFLVFTRPLPVAERARLLRLCSAVGVVAAIGLFLMRGTGSTWGAATLEPGVGAVLAAAIGSAWVLVATIDADQGRWDIGALVGAAASGVALFGTSNWAAPALLFWVVVSLAAAVSCRYSERSSAVWLGLALADAAFVGALVVWCVDHATWRMPESIEGWWLLPIVASIAIRAAVVPGAGIWGLATGPQVALLPLLVASAFALVPSVSGGDEVYVALGFLVIALVAAAWSLLSKLGVAAAGSWIVTLMLAVVWLHPPALARAGVAAALGLSIAVMWPRTSGRAQAERGLVLAAVPLTAGFGVVVGGAATSFERATLAETVLDAAPWGAFAALLPVALAAGVTLGATIARRAEPEVYDPLAVLGTWGLAAVALILGLSIRPELGFTGAGPAAARSTWLYLTAAVAAAIAVRMAPRDAAVALQVSEVPTPGTARVRGRPALALEVMAAVIGLPALAGVAWFTYTGLRNGFL